MVGRVIDVAWRCEDRSTKYRCCLISSPIYSNGVKFNKAGNPSNIRAAKARRHPWTCTTSRHRTFAKDPPPSLHRFNPSSEPLLKHHQIPFRPSHLIKRFCSTEMWNFGSEGSEKWNVHSPSSLFPLFLPRIEYLFFLYGIYRFSCHIPSLWLTLFREIFRPSRVFIGKGGNNRLLVSAPRGNPRIAVIHGISMYSHAWCFHFHGGG